MRMRLKTGPLGVGQRGLAGGSGGVRWGQVGSGGLGLAQALTDGAAPVSCGRAAYVLGSAGSAGSADSIAPVAWAAGSSMVKVDPRPGSDQTDTLPPWLSATCLTIARPRPVPPVARERAVSTR